MEQNIKIITNYYEIAIIHEAVLYFIWSTERYNKPNWKYHIAVIIKPKLSKINSTIHKVKHVLIRSSGMILYVSLSVLIIYVLLLRVEDGSDTTTIHALHTSRTDCV